MDNKSSKRDIIMIIITVVLVIAFAWMLYYDRNTALIERTTPLNISEDEYLEVVTVAKYGPMFRRVAYNAKIKVTDGYWEQYYVDLASDKETPGMFMTAADLQQYKIDVLSDLKPNPGELKTDSLNWVCTIKDEGYEITYVIDQETDGNAYIYIYYMKTKKI